MLTSKYTSRRIQNTQILVRPDTLNTYFRGAGGKDFAGGRELESREGGLSGSTIDYGRRGIESGGGAAAHRGKAIVVAGIMGELEPLLVRPSSK